MRLKHFTALAVAAALGVTSPVSAATKVALTEVLVLASAATALPTTEFTDGTRGRKSVEIQNLGPNAIYCAFTSAGTVITKSRKIDASGGIWVLEGVNEAITVFCRAATADQLTGAATIVSEVVYRGET